MALMTPQTVSNVLTPSFTAPGTSDTIQWTPGLLLYVKIGGTATTVTVAVPGTEPYSGVAVPDLGTGSISNTERVFVIPQLAADPTTSLVTVTYSQVTAVTSALIRVT